ncbi:single-stranded DNA-binding protein [Terriglobus sp. ADX1]|uniref:single-stranded DNA-binding protein n=1 Tax=Terriglobus sp. ADX1 TaxID=2794063 RepID=UPI002FE653AF
MGKGINRATLLGNVGRSPEVKSTQGGTLVASFSLATPDRVKRNGEWVDESQWHNVVAFGRTAEIIRDYVGKGSKLLIEGKIQTRSWDDKDSGRKQYRTEIIVNDLTLLDSKRDGGQQQRSDTSGYAVEETSGYGQAYVADNEDVPF